MAQTLTGTALEGRGSLITETFGNLSPTNTTNIIIITNTGESTYLNIEVEDGQTEFFTTGSNLAMTVLSKGGAFGVLAQSNAAGVTGTPDNSVFSWSRGKEEYNFIATSTSPLPADKVEDLGNDYKKYTFYLTWSATAGTLGTNLAGKITEADVDGLTEISAGLSAAGFLYLNTNIGTTKFNGMKIFRNGVVFATMNNSGKNAYPIAGREQLNPQFFNQPTPYIPFIAGETNASIIVPNTNQFENQRIEIAFKAGTGTLAANLFRMSTAGSGANISAEIYGQ